MGSADTTIPNQEVRTTWPTLLHELDPSLLPSMLEAASSVATDLVSTTADHALPAVSTTPSLLLDTEAREDKTTTWSRTRGQSDGEPVDTSRWPETEETTAESPPNHP